MRGGFEGNDKRPCQIQHPFGWMFVLLWLLAYFVGGMLYVLPVSAVQFLLRLDGFSNVQHVAEADRAFVVFATSSVGAACGLSIGFFQWLVLRREFQGIRSWIAATTLGFASLGILPVIAGILRPDWPAWAFTLIIDGKFHWLARLMPDWPWPRGSRDGTRSSPLCDTIDSSAVAPQCNCQGRISRWYTSPNNGAHRMGGSHVGTELGLRVDLNERLLCINLCAPTY
jgi:hypothetical protein